MAEMRKRRLRDRATGPATLIGDGCKIAGTIGGVGNFLINGEIEGDCDVDGTITIAKDGKWTGFEHDLRENTWKRSCQHYRV